MAKKPNAVFEVEFAGIYPEQIPLGTLSRTLSAVRSLAIGTEEFDAAEREEEQEDLVDSAQRDIQLLNVKRGSAVLSFSGKAPEKVIDNLRQVGTVLKNPERIGEYIRILSPIEELSASARRLSCTIFIKNPLKETRANGVLAKIEPTSFESIAQSAFIYGDTSISGVVERVGGATKIKCGLRVTFQKRMLFCHVSNKEVARTLGEHVYREVIVNGRATWIRSSWKIYGFKIDGVQHLDDCSASEAMDALRTAGGSAWDKIDDPEQFLEETRTLR